MVVIETRISLSLFFVGRSGFGPHLRMPIALLQNQIIYRMPQLSIGLPLDCVQLQDKFETAPDIIF